MNLKKRIAAGIVTVSILATVLPAAVFADTTIKIDKNGKNSKNTVTVTNNTTSKKIQKNYSLVFTGVLSAAGTGGNTIADTTGGTGDPSIKTGSATSKVDVTVGGSSNKGSEGQCPCDLGKTDVTISGNGDNSTNKVDVKNSSGSVVVQKNIFTVGTLVGSFAGTGENTISGTTGGDSSITSGSANSEVTIKVDGSSNSL
ncbi:MAG: hypothetical protein M1268_02305 [Patescibacteria group bacterium]|nr:hypothetical protein [Patescibacteria group bacterium]